MAATLTSMNAALKRIHTSDSIVEQIFQGNELLDKLQKQTRYQPGETARVTLHTSRNGGTTVLPDGGGTLNTAGQQGLNKAEYNYKHLHQQIAIQEDVIEATRGNAAALAEVLDVEVSGAVNDLRKQLTRMLFGNGDSIICGVRTKGANAVIDLDLTDGANAVERGWLFGEASNPGLPVDIGTAGAQTSLISGEQILAVTDDVTNPQITVTTAVATTAGTHFVSLKGARTGATSFETNGLRNVVSTSATLGGLAAGGVWKAANVDTTSQALTLTLMLQQQQKVNQKAGDVPDTIITGLKQQRKFYEALQQQVHFGGDSSLGAGNVDAPTWNGMQLIVHPDCPNEDMYFLRFKHLFQVASRKPFWQNSITGGEILAWIQGTSSYGAKLAYHFNVGTERRNIFARLGGLN